MTVENKKEKNDKIYGILWSTDFWGNPAVGPALLAADAITVCPD